MLMPGGRVAVAGWEASYVTVRLLESWLPNW
jgi:hypothetical protein